MKELYTNIDYRNAKIIRIAKKEEARYLYKKKEISKEEAIELLESCNQDKEKRKR